MNILEWLKSFFKKDFKALQKESENIVSVFKQTVDNLNKVNEKVLAEHALKEKAVAALQQEMENLRTLNEANNRVMLNIKSIIS